jgi:hypothetical protein
MTEANAPAGSRRSSVVSWVLIAVTMVGGFSGIYLLSRDEPHRAKVGDCVAQDGQDSVHLVDCAGSDAEYTVVGRLEDTSQISAGIGACGDFETATSSYWEGEQGGKGTVLCLARKKG